MKILCVTPSYWPAFQFGGPIFSVHGLNKTLVKKKVDITVYTTNVGLEGKVPVNQEIEVDGVKVTYFTFIKFFEFLGSTGWQLSLKLTNALRSNLRNFDIVNIVSIWKFPVSITPHYCRKYDKPYVLSTCGMLYPYTLSKKPFKKLPYLYLIVKRDLQNATAILYTTQDELEQCHQALGLKNKACVIPDGIDLSEFSNLPENRVLIEKYPYLKGKKLILFLGRIHWKKGLDILIKAYSKLVRNNDNVHLLIVGNDEGGYSEKVKKWIKEYGLSYWDQVASGKDCNLDVQVSFTGMLKGREKLEALTASSIFVLSSYSENFGMSVVEAMACGVPVVISNRVGIYKEVQKNKAGIVVDADAESLYGGIKMLLENSDLRKEISINGRKLVEDHYDIEEVAETTVEMYKKMIKGND